MDALGNVSAFHEVTSSAPDEEAGRVVGQKCHHFDRLRRVGPVVVGLDDTIERRWGSKIKARGIYRDPVRSSHSHFVKTSGLRWLSAMLLVKVPWADRVWALPFLTVLCPSERYSAEHQVRHKKLTDWARQMLRQIAR